ncbi:hypothetical protein QAD02_008600 [Eretmocerus hayati]|uniref:Uncharacterized protein n=1 Tax=Eretmocerus hayati TaxID=131215 RepID=A0ACC2N717_9HYME|nr:hypothetical protein QAD02_008600 [Eretmocerus hayati]
MMHEGQLPVLFDNTKSTTVEASISTSTMNSESPSAVASTAVTTNGNPLTPNVNTNTLNVVSTNNHVEHSQQGGSSPAKVIFASQLVQDTDENAATTSSVEELDISGKLE